MTIFNLQVLRGIAALGVVFYHTDYRLPGDWHTEFFGVSTFFVLSGFIMCFISRDPKGGDATPAAFLKRRVIRIVPLYWFCTLVYVALFHRPPFTLKIDLLLEWISVKVPHIFCSLFFAPSDARPILGVGWTLNFETYFYVVFAVAMLLSRRFAPLIACAIIYAVIKSADYGVDYWLITFYSHKYVHYFLHGIVLFYCWSFLKDHLPKRPTLIVCVGTVIAIYGSQFIPPQEQMDHYGAAYFPTLLIASALFAASAGADITWKPLLLLGDASYAIYLTHTIIMPLLREHTPAWKQSLIVTLAVVVISTVVGIVAHIFVEKPILRYIRQYRTHYRVA